MSAVHSIRDSGDDLVEVPGIMSGHRMERFVREFKAMSIRINDRHKRVSSVRKAQWVVRDRVKFDRLIQELSHLVSKLNEIIPDTKGSMVSISEADFAGIGRIQKIRLILKASSSPYR